MRVRIELELIDGSLSSARDLAKEISNRKEVKSVVIIITERQTVSEKIV